MKDSRLKTLIRSRILAFFLSLSIIALYLLTADAFAEEAEELEMINRPVNASGLTGLLFTTAPYTASSKTIEISAAAISEKSTTPDYSINELPSISATMGITESMELALKGSYFHNTTAGGIKERGAGETELSYKWNFLPQAESSSLPALAVIVTGIAAGSNKNANPGRVTHWGARFGLSAGREIIWGDHVIGIYADAQMVVHDLMDENLRDRYGIVNAGLLFPISKYRNLQMLIEYTMVNGIDKITAQGGDYSGITYGLRLVNERFNLSIGTQFLHKLVQGFENSNRIIGMASIKF
jgi:hypothetical protein